MKKTVTIAGIEDKAIRDKVKKLSRKSFYFIKGYKIDDIPLQFTHFYKEYLRFKILSWPTEESQEVSTTATPFGPISYQRPSGLHKIRMLRIKRGMPPKEKITCGTKQTRLDRMQAHLKRLNSMKGFINLRYTTMQKAPYITFEEIPFEDLPLFIGSSHTWTHLKDILGVSNNN